MVGFMTGHTIKIIKCLSWFIENVTTIRVDLIVSELVIFFTLVKILILDSKDLASLLWKSEKYNLHC